MMCRHNGNIYNITSSVKFQGISKKSRQEECKNERTRKATMELFLLEMAGNLHAGQVKNRVA